MNSAELSLLAKLRALDQRFSLPAGLLTSEQRRDAAGDRTMARRDVHCPQRSPHHDGHAVRRRVRVRAVSMPRYNGKRDANEPDLITFARQLGAEFEKIGPLDFWVGVRGRWVPLEIKTDEGTYTPKQVNFIARCRARGLPVWTWRTEFDVMRDLGARRTA